MAVFIFLTTERRNRINSSKRRHLFLFVLFLVFLECQSWLNWKFFAECCFLFCIYLHVVILLWCSVVVFFHFYIVVLGWMLVLIFYIHFYRTVFHAEGINNTHLILLMSCTLVINFSTSFGRKKKQKKHLRSHLEELAVFSEPSHKNRFTENSRNSHHCALNINLFSPRYALLFILD